MIEPGQLVFLIEEGYPDVFCIFLSHTMPSGCLGKFLVLSINEEETQLCPGETVFWQLNSIMIYK